MSRAGAYLLATAHRAGNVDDPERLRALVERADRACRCRSCCRCIRARGRGCRGAGLLDALDGVVLAPPLGYLEFTALLLGARAVLTDSGGVQKEAYLAGVPCITLRDTTEWRETVDAGWNVLVDLDARRGAARRWSVLCRPQRPALYGDGRAGERVVEALVRMADDPLHGGDRRRRDARRRTCGSAPTP